MIEEENVLSKFKYVSFWKRLLVAFVDFLLVESIGILDIIVFQQNKIIGTISKIVFLTLNWVFLIINYIVLYKKYGGNIAKLLFKIRVINKDGNYLTYLQAFIRISPYFIICILLGILDVRLHIKSSRGILGLVLIIFTLVDAFSILSNKEKRSLHDRMAGSYVVTEKSRLAYTNKKNMQIGVEKTI